MGVPPWKPPGMDTHLGTAVPRLQGPLLYEFALWRDWEDPKGPTMDQEPSSKTYQNKESNRVRCDTKMQSTHNPIMC